MHKSNVNPAVNHKYDQVQKFVKYNKELSSGIIQESAMGMREKIGNDSLRLLK